MTTVTRPGQRDGSIRLGIIDWAIVLTLLTGIFSSVGLLLKQEHRMTLMEAAIANAAHDAAVASQEARDAAAIAATGVEDNRKRIEALERARRGRR